MQKFAAKDGVLAALSRRGGCRLWLQEEKAERSRRLLRKGESEKLGYRSPIRAAEMVSWRGSSGVMGE